MYYPQTMSQANQAELWDAGVGSGGPSLHDAPGQTSTSPFFFIYLFFFAGAHAAPLQMPPLASAHIAHMWNSTRVLGLACKLS